MLQATSIAYSVQQRYNGPSTAGSRPICLEVPAAAESVQGELGIAVRRLDRSFVPSGTIISMVTCDLLVATSTRRVQRTIRGP